jgi:hypothetical protein
MTKDCRRQAVRKLESDIPQMLEGADLTAETVLSTHH